MVSASAKQRPRPAGQLVILSAPSGAGKTSLAKALAGSIANFEVSVSHTTRPARKVEEEGVDYFFVSTAVFEHMIAADDFLEYALVFDHLYGTAQQPVKAALESGCSIALDIDWQGARKVRALIPEAISVFIAPPSLEDLECRLIDRRRDSDEIIRRRMNEAINEISHYSEFDYVIVNEDFITALEELRAIVLTGQVPSSSKEFNPATFLQS